MIYKDFEALKQAVKERFDYDGQLRDTEKQISVKVTGSYILGELFSWDYPFAEMAETFNRLAEFYYVQKLQKGDEVPPLIEDIERFADGKRMLQTAFSFLDALQKEYIKNEKEDKQDSNTQTIVFD